MAAADLGNQEGDLERGARYEQAGFTWCKIGSIALIALFPKPALILASAVVIYYYARALMLGVTASRCILRHALVIIAFWMVVLAVTVASLLSPWINAASSKSAFIPSRPSSGAQRPPDTAARR